MTGLNLGLTPRQPAPVLRPENPLRPVARRSNVPLRVNRTPHVLQRVTDFSGLSRMAATIAGIESRVRREREMIAAEDAPAAEARLALLGDASFRLNQAQDLRDAVPLEGPLPTREPDEGLVLGDEGVETPRTAEHRKVRRELAQLARNDVLPAHRNPVFREKFSEARGVRLAKSAGDLLFSQLGAVATFGEGVGEGRDGMSTDTNVDAAIRGTIRELYQSHPYLNPESPNYNRTASNKFFVTFGAIADKFRDEAEDLQRVSFARAYEGNELQGRVDAVLDEALKNLRSPSVPGQSRETILQQTSSMFGQLMKDAVAEAGLKEPKQVVLRRLSSYLNRIARDSEDPYDRAESIHEVLDVLDDVSLGGAVLGTDLDYQESVQKRFLSIAASGDRTGGNLGRGVIPGLSRRESEMVVPLMQQLRKLETDDDPSNDLLAREDFLEALADIPNNPQLQEGRARPLSTVQIENMRLRLEDLGRRTIASYDRPSPQQGLVLQRAIAIAHSGKPDDARKFLHDNIGRHVDGGSPEYNNTLQRINAIADAVPYKIAGSEYDRFVSPITNRIAALRKQVDSVDPSVRVARGPMRDLVNDLEDKRAVLDDAFAAMVLQAQANGDDDTAVRAKIGDWFQNAGRALIQDMNQANRTFETGVDDARAMAEQLRTEFRVPRPEEQAQLAQFLGRAEATQIVRGIRAATQPNVVMGQLQPELSQVTARIRLAARAAVETNEEFQAALNTIRAENPEAASDLFNDTVLDQVTKIRGRMIGEINALREAGNATPMRHLSERLQVFTDEAVENLGGDMAGALREAELEGEAATTARIQLGRDQRARKVVAQRHGTITEAVENQDAVGLQQSLSQVPMPEASRRAIPDEMFRRRGVISAFARTGRVAAGSGEATTPGISAGVIAGAVPAHEQQLQALVRSFRGKEGKDQLTWDVMRVANKHIPADQVIAGTIDLPGTDSIDVSKVQALNPYETLFFRDVDDLEAWTRDRTRVAALAKALKIRIPTTKTPTGGEPDLRKHPTFRAFVRAQHFHIKTSLGAR